MEYLTHCTSFINALHIIMEKKVYFGNLMFANDETEKAILENEEYTLYAFCTFGAEWGEISSTFWMTYAGRNKGAAITFCFENEADIKEMSLPKKSDKGETEEIESFKMEYAKDEDVAIGENPEKMGRLKNNIFEGEKEYRFIIKQPHRNYDSHIVRELNVGKIKKIILAVDYRLEKIARTIFPEGNEYNVKVLPNIMIN